ncbi:hypothetical protein [Leptospira stimsonii]|nr:hypothetical protein [Leptospira stimsonii]
MISPTKFQSLKSYTILMFAINNFLEFFQRILRRPGKNAVIKVRAT